MQFKDRLYFLRHEKGMTQTELAEKLSVSVQSVSVWELGRQKPSVDTIIVIADFFGVSLDYLTGRTNER